MVDAYRDELRVYINLQSKHIRPLHLEVFSDL